jgi:hypothetical protein
MELLSCGGTCSTEVQSCASTRPSASKVVTVSAPAQVVDWLLQHADRFDYQWDLHGDLMPCAPQ